MLGLSENGFKFLSYIRVKSIRMKVILVILSLLLVTGLSAQTDKVVIKLDTISSGLDSFYVQQKNELTQQGYSRTGQGRWLNSSGDELFVSVPAFAYPQNGYANFFYRIKEEFQYDGKWEGSGSVIFTVSKKGELFDFYCSSTGDTSIQNSLLKILETEPIWGPGIWSGPLVNAIYKLTVCVK